MKKHIRNCHRDSLDFVLIPAVALSEASLKSKLESLSTIKTVEVEYTNGNSPCSRTGGETQITFVDFNHSGNLPLLSVKPADLEIVGQQESASLFVSEIQRGYSSPSVTMIRVDIRRNAAIGGRGAGGGIYAEEGMMLHMDSSVVENKPA